MINRAPHRTAVVNRDDVFWGEISPSEHFAHFYEHEDSLLDMLAGFLGDGLKAGDAAIVIATKEHLSGIHRRLQEQGLDLGAARSKERYISLIAEEALTRFMVNHWPDEELFLNILGDLLARARGTDNRRVRAFGEMVALLWARGDHAATVRLEHLWHQACQRFAFPLYCAYPKAGFTKDQVKSVAEICTAHSRVI